LACAVAEAVLDHINTPAMRANVSARAAQLRDGLAAIGKRYGIFDAPRGLGLLVGAPMSAAWKGRAKEVVTAGLKHGVWTLVAGPDVLRLAPALNITEADVAEGLSRLDAACAELTATAKAA
jgi:acetylornithine/N-succinyldiaminopimelate aminotransferase